jgi:hypothetical protein
MKLTFEPIKLNEQGFHVTRLHQVLAAFGLRVSPREVSVSKAGTDTQRRIRSLQVQLKLKVPRSSFLLDEITIQAIVKAMTDRGLLATGHSFEVSGAVKLSNGSSKKFQRLIAFDLDLRGVSVYRTLKDLKGTKKSGGFEFLGEAVSDNNGHYSISFYDWQYSRLERKLADVVVFALGDKDKIIGHSRLVNTEDYSDKGFVRDLDIFLTIEDERTEYQALMEPLTRFLAENKTSLAEIALSHDQLAFTASELDVDLSRLELAATAQLLVQEESRLSHELLYGIARQDIRLAWPVLYSKTVDELVAAIAKSVDENIISELERRVGQFISFLKKFSIEHVLGDKDEDGKNSLTDMLSNALPEKPQREAYLKALGSFIGDDFREFWKTHLPEQPEFKRNPELIPAIQLTQQLSALTGNHQPLMKVLQIDRGINSAEELIDFKEEHWLEFVRAAGVPDSIEGKDEAEKQKHYANSLQSWLNATYPTLRIAKMVAEDQLGIENDGIKKGVSRFLKSNEGFDFFNSRVHDFQRKIEEASDEGDSEAVKSELMKVQRVVQVSTSPEVMTVLLKNNLHSAYSITNIPRKNFINSYSEALGGERTAMAVHQRAEFIRERAEGIVMDVKEYSSDTATPAKAMSSSDKSDAETLLEKKFPSYKNIFGSPDLCECQHCRSVYSPAAYFVELLQFLRTSESNLSDKKPTPYDVLIGKNVKPNIGKNVKPNIKVGRRPDLAELPLSCENTNTLIPYIDLVNEVMEFYVANRSLRNYRGENTGEATADELRANPQHTDIEAYRILSDNVEQRPAKYPFDLPYHQPLNVIRTYSDFLNVSRYEVMQVVNPEPDDKTARAIGAEAFGFSQEEYSLLVGESFDATPDNTEPHEYFGYSASEDLEKLSPVREFMNRSGVVYTELVELIKTRFINPHQDTLDFLEKIFSHKSTNPNTIYTRLKVIKETGVLDKDNDADIIAALSATGVGTEVFQKWVADHFSKFQQVITLFEPDSACNLDTTRLRTIEKIYEAPDTEETLGVAGITPDSWSKFHRFIRLWRKTGWSIHETDLMLSALGENEISPETITKLESVLLLKKASNLPLDQLAVLWGNIDTYGNKSLYKKLFLNKAVQQIDQAFVADPQGNYLVKELDNGEKITLAMHQSTILAGFRISEEELNTILVIAEVSIEDFLNLQKLSAIYRYVILAKALKLSVIDLSKLVALFESKPFNSPKDTYEFYKLATSTKTPKFKPAVLEYIFEDDLPVDSKLDLGKDRVLQTAKSIRSDFAIIEQNHPQIPDATLTSEIVVAKLSVSFQPEIVSRFMEIVEGAAIFKVKIDTNLGVKIPEDLKDKYSYIEGSGWFSCIGNMSAEDRDKLKNVSNNSNNDKFKTAVDELYKAPETFISDAFKEVFAIHIPENLEKLNKIVLNRPTTDPVINKEEKLEYIYQSFLPLLKRKLQQDAVTTHIADVIGLSEAATTLLIADDFEELISDLSTQGFSASYFNDRDLTGDTNLALERVDNTVDFSWRNGSPDLKNVTADNFSVRWKTYFSAPASGEYTLIVEVEEKDEACNLYLDGELIINKDSGDNKTSFEEAVSLNAAQLHLLILEYAEESGSAGIRLRWKTATSAAGIIPSTATYPAHILNGFVKDICILHRAAKFIQGFKISEAELKYFIANNADFDNINFAKLDPVHWKRIRDYYELRNSVQQTQAFLTNVFSLANQTDPMPIIKDLEEIILQTTGWDKTSLNYLIQDHFNLGIDDFKNESALNRILAVIRIVSKTGLSAETIAKWGAAETDFDKLHNTAQLLKNTVKAKYDDNEWLDLAGGLSDKIRENQKLALISYLLVQDSIRIDEDIKDADGLFEHFLIDVQMGACMETSRIVQANAAIQLFVNRILLNLEKDISPDTIDSERWQWMKNYRVWEANRKVFLYPENWLEPEWRNDRSEFFKELESHLLQNDITARNVEQGLRNYLMSLNEVANLDVCGMHQENDKGKLKFLHVFGRTHNIPYKYFYRSWNEYQKWSTWVKMPVDIRSVENGESSGVHLIPVVWKGRLFLFWPEFMEVSREPGNQGESLEDLSKEPSSELNPIKDWEISLAWSEYVDGNWSSKQVSKEFIEIKTSFYRKDRLEEFKFESYLDSEDRLVIKTITHGYAMYSDEEDVVWSSINHGLFKISDITSKVEIQYPDDVPKKTKIWGGEYGISFMSRFRFSKKHLFLNNNDYLYSEGAHKLLFTSAYKSISKVAKFPFFFSDVYRTYFVQSSGSTISWGRGESLNPNSFVKTMFLDNRPTGLPDSTSGLGRSSSTGVAFSGGNFNFGEIIRTENLEFHTFYHPFSSKLVARLNQGGISALMGSDTEDLIGPDESLPTDTITSDKGKTFDDKYDPKFGLVSPNRNNLRERTYYQENICFDVFGANSLYNWELFFHAPLYIATRLSKNGKYEEAMKWFHYIFDPTTNEAPDPDNISKTSRYWKVRPFKIKSDTRLEDLFENLKPDTDVNNPLIKMINEWRENPFDPHLVASNRPIAYMKHVVIKYIENLMDWGDSLFRQFTRESVYEAIQLYVIASHILGERPQFVPKRGKIETRTYADLKDKLDAFGNALVELENIFPYSSEVNPATPSTGGNFLGIGPDLYFCIPANDKLLEYWDTVADRLFKIRHCQDLDGVERGLALFAPAIDPAALIQANSQGLSLGSILSDLSSPPPIYRFAYLIQKANEFCSDVKALGSALLSAIEKKDAEELSRLRASQETNILELVTAIRERQVLAAKSSKDNLLKVRETAKFRLEHYTKLLGNDSVAVPDVPSIDTTLTVNSQLPSDTGIELIETDVDESLVDSDESGVKLIGREVSEIKLTEQSAKDSIANMNQEIIAGFMGLVSQFDAQAQPMGVGGAVSFGGQQLGWMANSKAKMFATSSQLNSIASNMSAKMASYLRREQDWTLQANLAIREIIQLDKQITSADIQIQVAEKELQNHKQQIDNSKEIELFLKDKFTNQELYQWMKEQLFSVYKQSYNLAFEMAKKAEKAYQYELGTENTNFIQYGYWDNSMEGLVAGEKLQLALRQLDKSFLEDNRRELELSKSISMMLTNPLSLLELKETGKCYLSLPEELFDLDFQGHYFRRIKAVSLSIPCVAGPYTTVNCTLRLLKNTLRKNTTINSDFNGFDGYEHDNDGGGVLLDDDRFRSNHVPVTSIATSSGQNDAGMFEFNFRDERYLPFERAGAISDWMIELSTEKELRQFDYSTISDVILHLKYTARETGGTFKEEAVSHIKNYIANKSEQTDEPLMQLLSMKHEFPTEWHKFQNPAQDGATKVLTLTIGKQRFPFLTQGRNIEVMKIDVFAKSDQDNDFELVYSQKPDSHTSISMKIDPHYDELHNGKLPKGEPNDPPLELDIEKELTLELKPDVPSLVIEDLLLVLHYNISLQEGNQQ